MSTVVGGLQRFSVQKQNQFIFPLTKPTWRVMYDFWSTNKFNERLCCDNTQTYTLFYKENVVSRNLYIWKCRIKNEMHVHALNNRI